jgi:hypothetical protein
VPSPVPTRDRRVYFAGAGLSCAFGLPNTATLITDTLKFSESPVGAWLDENNLKSKLERAFSFFYPDAKHAGFQPDVVDFFSALRTFLDVGAGLVGTGFADAPDLYRLLRRGIAHLLLVRTQRASQSSSFVTNSFLSEMVQPGHIIITSNWDVLIEEFARANSIPLRRSSSGNTFGSKEVALLKLHGSIDWCQVSARTTGHGDSGFATLRELESPPNRRYRPALPKEPEAIVRVRPPIRLGSQEPRRRSRAYWNLYWRRIRVQSREPYMVTMATGKSDDLGPLRETWRDAYRALSRASSLELVGYSMPSDDVEIRTILRTGMQRSVGRHTPEIRIKNPSPDVHNRVRSYLDRFAESDYLPITGVN